MAKEDDLKRVDLKVSVNCCDGCKRKVLKALSIKGVLKTEIHPTLPKITVTGNIQVHTLIKKLAKSGKTAELWPMETPKPEREDNKSKSSERNEKHLKIEEEKSSSKPAGKSSNSVDINDQSNKANMITGSNEGDSNRGAKESTCDISETSTPQVTKNLIYPTIVTAVPPVNCVVNPSMIQNQMMIPHYPIENYVVPMPPYYTVNNSYPAQMPFYYGLPVYQPPPPMHTQATGLADYFNDDNTSGCHVM